MCGWLKGKKTIKLKEFDQGEFDWENLISSSTLVNQTKFTTLASQVIKSISITALNSTNVWSLI